MDAVVETINWREQFSDLEPYLDGAGAVVRVRYRERSGHLAFMEALTNQFHDGAWDGPIGSVRIDPAVSSTRYVADIRNEILRRAEVAKRPAAPRSPLPDVSIRDVRSKRDAIITVNLTGDEDDAERARRDDAGRVVAEMKAFLTKGRFMIILTDDPATGHRAFWQDVWATGLDQLPRVLVVQFQNAAITNRHVCSRQPQPVIGVELPESYGMAEAGHASEDLEALLIRRNAGADARGMAKGLVVANRHDVGAFHSAVGAVLMDLKIQKAGAR